MAGPAAARGRSGLSVHLMSATLPGGGGRGNRSMDSPGSSLTMGTNRQTKTAVGRRHLGARISPWAHARPPGTSARTDLPVRPYHQVGTVHNVSEFPESPENPTVGDAYETRREAVARSQSESAYDPDYAAVEEGHNQEDVRQRANLLPEEQTAGGSADPEAQARVILEDSLARTEVPGAAPSTHLEHRRSEDRV